MPRPAPEARLRNNCKYPYHEHANAGPIVVIFTPLPVGGGIPVILGSRHIRERYSEAFGFLFVQRRGRRESAERGRDETGRTRCEALDNFGSRDTPLHQVDGWRLRGQRCGCENSRDAERYFYFD